MLSGFGANAAGTAHADTGNELQTCPGGLGKMKKQKIMNYKRIWYMLCFLALGFIDQRRGSAVGTVQMAAANCVGIVLAAMLLPCLKKECFRHKVYAVWSVIAVTGGIAAGLWGWQNFEYKGQWVTGVLNVAVWGYLVIYIFRERKTLEVSRRVRQPFFWCMALLFFLMQISAYGGVRPIWMTLIFGGFYLLGIKKENREDFFQGMLNGIILWFFVQQITAYGFRPYDRVRYRGMYSGETQNGIFYMIVYCAFLCKWIWAKNRGKHRVWVWIYFFLSAGSISFLLFTGGRSSLMGAAMATLTGYVICDIVWKKSFYKWLLHVAALGVCVALTFPLVYGTIRYLPTILHHPIWFEGEYLENSSVRSFDPWDSERYITFQEALETNIGRIFEVFGIDMSHLPFGIEAQAAELEDDPGSSPENPFVLPGTEEGGTVDRRKNIFACYLAHLNFGGHGADDQHFYLAGGYITQHAHNMLIQMAYDYGIPAGILFLGLTVYSLFHFWRRAVKGMEDYKWLCLAFFTAVFFYGMTEMAIVPGMITWVLIYLLFYFAGEDSFAIRKEELKTVVRDS